MVERESHSFRVEIECRQLQKRNQTRDRSLSKAPQRHEYLPINKNIDASNIFVDIFSCLS